MTVKFITIGCKTNFYESEALTELFQNAGFDITQSDYADIYIVNTCAVTAAGASRSRRLLRQCRNHNPNAVVAAAGCLSQLEGEAIAALSDIVTGTSDRAKLVDIISEYIKNGKHEQKLHHITPNAEYEAPQYENLSISSYHSRTRIFIKIQDGCNNFCSYCIIPHARGRARSRNAELIIDEARTFIENGAKEIILTGTNISAYDQNLATLINRLNNINGLFRIRLGSLEPILINEEFIESIKPSDKLCPHFHLSLQSGNDRILKEMNRRYTTSDFRHAVELIRSNFNDSAITTDVICGFPGESNDEFDETLRFCKEIGFAQMHVFKYSKRNGTIAANMTNQIHNAVKIDRVCRLVALSDEMSRSYRMQYINRTLPVLFEQTGNFCTGYTPNYIQVSVPPDNAAINSIRNVRLTHLNNDGMAGEPL